MNLVIDIGNTFAKAAVFKGNQLQKAVHFRRNDLGPLEAFLEDVEPIACAFSSVADHTENIEAMLGRLNCRVLHVTGQTPVPFVNLYSTPRTLGSDRLAAVAGAYKLLPGKNVLVIDAGTCITYDFIDANGCYHGGNISPGPAMRFQMLHEQTARLPLIDADGEKPLLGDDTKTAIRSGVLHGVRYEMQGYINELSEEHSNLKVIMTGGKKKNLILSYEIWNDIVHEPYLVEIGLNAILQYNLNTPKL